MIGKRWIIGCWIAAMGGCLMACAPQAVREAEDVVAQADSLWHAGKQNSTTQKMTNMKKNKNNKRSRTLPKWQIYLVTGLIIICPFALYFGLLFGEKIYVDQHYEKVRAVIVRIKKLPGRAASRNTYYHYNYDNHSYKGKAITNYHDNIGEVGDSIVIRCRIERPYVSYYNVGDNPSIIHE